MQQRHKKYLVAFLLFLLIFPQIEKGIHALRHMHDDHCRVVGEFHFHEKEHSCSLCDYSNTISNSPELLNYTAFLTAHSTSYQLYSNQVILTLPEYQFSLKAPPAI
jgi:hypothetical protein